MTIRAIPVIDYAKPASARQVLETADAVRARGITVEIVDTPSKMSKVKRQQYASG